MRRPLVGVTADLRTYDNSLMHTVGDKYARAVWEASGCTPIIIPAMAESQQVVDMLDSLDGLLFTGSPSNVHPTRYGQGIDAAAPGIEVEDLAPDGTPEAVSVRGAKRFALGVQWHPEYKPLENDFSTRLFRAFSEAVHGKDWYRPFLSSGRSRRSNIPQLHFCA